MISISLAVTVDSWRHGLWMHCLLRCNTWNNIAVKSRKDSELHDVTFVSEDGLLCPAHKVMLWSQNALPKFIFQNIALPKFPFHPLLHLIVWRKASLRPTSCQLDGEGSSQACIICGILGSWIPGTFYFARHFFLTPLSVGQWFSQCLGKCGSKWHLIARHFFMKILKMPGKVRK